MDKLIINEETIKNKIYTIRGIQVMLDRDLAELYQVETRRLNEQVKRNIDRFPEDFMFQFTKEEFENWRSQFVMSNSDKMGLRRPPYAFTEQGVSMLSAVLKTDFDIEITKQIIEILMFERFERIEQRLSEHDEKFDMIFKSFEDESIIDRENLSILERLK